ncbi:hypothetical protein SEA_TEATEALATTE_71 [Gordonia phage Teatealatte]|uniref:Uncharacterized protein n=2 Tax=Demosthenesvirus katyusha TaxID=1982108 RepID=A0A345MCA7_9CAUD|nr:hypothetical protein SEA_TEATEALATTE_71 [Gordonia phage Teatealatte]QBP29626.1 hypothetical protein SEA_TREDGE_70 [Gordonia phage Tredge]
MTQRVEIFPTPAHKVEVGKLKYIFECSQPGCQWLTYHRSEEAAVNEKTRHDQQTCPYEVPASRQGGKNLTARMWDEMDRLYLKFYELKKSGKRDDAEFHYLKGQLNGMAFAILELSKPHFLDIREVAEWAEKRRTWNDPEHAEYRQPTPAVDRVPLPPHLTKRVAAKKAAPVKSSTPASNPKTGKFKALKESDINAIKKMHGNFPKETIMSILKISSDQYDHEAAKLDGS